MKTFIALLIGGMLALAGTVIAQQPEGQESPSKKGGRSEKTTAEGATETKTKSNAGEARGNKGRSSTESNATQPTTTGATGETGTTRGGKRARGAKSENATATGAETSPAGTSGTEPTTTRGGKGKRGRNATTAETGASASPGVSVSPGEGKAGGRGRGAKAAGASPSPAASVSATAAAAVSASPAMSAAPATSATVAAGTTGATGAMGATGTNATAANAQGNLKGQGTVGRGGKRVEQQQVQQIKQQHASFKAQPRPDKAPAVQFNSSYRIQGSDRWQGQRYTAFREYRPEMHDRGWYHSHFGRIELIAGGYYYFNNGYWYPAWGYDQSAQYYAYDGPIYVGRTSAPPDRVIADVQAELKDMGYYEGEVDGLLGPLTRQALQGYQADHGLEVTEAIDEPTLDALQLG